MVYVVQCLFLSTGTTLKCLHVYRYINFYLINLKIRDYITHLSLVSYK